jgi:hypothetical protein
MYYKVLLLSFFLHSLLFSQEKKQSVINAWEPEEELSHFNTYEPSDISFSVLFTHTANTLITYYQTTLSTNSIRRCPYKISCSNFAKEAIKRYYIFGVHAIVDRYFFRENSEMFAHYKPVQIENGVIKLDDAFFLSE